MRYWSMRIPSVGKKSLAVVLLLVVALGAVALFVVFRKEPLENPAASSKEAGELPALVIEASYPGANAREVADTVAHWIEQELVSMENLHALWSQSTNDGTYALTITLEPGTDLDTAQVVVQNRVSLVLPHLPADVQKSITVRKKPGRPLLLAVLSSDGTYDSLSLSNYARLQLLDPLTRTAGVGDVQGLGLVQEGIQILLDSMKLSAHDLTPGGVIEAVRKQEKKEKGKPGKKEENRGESSPTLPLVQRNDIEELERIVLKTSAGGGTVRLRDVARVERGSHDRGHHALLNGRPVVALLISPTYQAEPGAVSAAVRERLEGLRKKLPAGLQLDIPFDFTPKRNDRGEAASADHLRLDVTLPGGASMERTRQVLSRCRKILQTISGVQTVLEMCGSPATLGTNEGGILVRLAAADGGRPSREEIAGVIRSRLGQEIKEAVVRLCAPSGSDPFPLHGYDFDLAVYGPDRDKVKLLADDLVKELSRSEKLTDVRSGPRTCHVPNLHVEISGSGARRLGVPQSAVLNAIGPYLAPILVINLDRHGVSLPVTVAVENSPDRVMGSGDLKNVKIRDGQDKLVPIEDVAKVRHEVSFLSFDRVNLHPLVEWTGELAVEITANLAAPASPAEVRALAEQRFEEIRTRLGLPAVYRMTWRYELAAAK